MARRRNNKKYPKIKRTHDGSSRRITPLEVIIATAVIVILMGVGWVSYTPIYNYLMQLEGNSSSSLPPSSEPATPDTPEETVPIEPVIPEPVQQGVKAVYIPLEILQNETALDAFLAGLKEQDINAVMVEMKNSVGTVLYNTASPLAARAQSISPTPLDIDALAAKLKAQDLTLIARVHTFKDSIAPNLLHQASVKYQGTDINWIDNYAAQGGKLWLNPYSELAWQYLTELSVELTQKGFDYILLDSIHFPTGVGLDKAYYGATAGTVPKAEQLNRFVQSITATVAMEGAGGKVLAYVPASAALGLNASQYDEQAAKIVDKGAVLGLMPSQFGNNLTSSTIIIDKPLLSPYETVNKAAGAVLPMLPQGTEVFGMIQAYTADGVSADANKPYTAEDVVAQIKALADNNIINYILYHPQGAYPVQQT